MSPGIEILQYERQRIRNQQFAPSGVLRAIRNRLEFSPISGNTPISWRSLVQITYSSLRARVVRYFELKNTGFYVLRVLAKLSILSESYVENKKHLHSSLC